MLSPLPAPKSSHLDEMWITETRRKQDLVGGGCLKCHRRVLTVQLWAAGGLWAGTRGWGVLVCGEYQPSPPPPCPPHSPPSPPGACPPSRDGSILLILLPCPAPAACSGKSFSLLLCPWGASQKKKRASETSSGRGDTRRPGPAPAGVLGCC